MGEEQRLGTSAGGVNEFKHEKFSFKPSNLGLGSHGNHLLLAIESNRSTPQSR